MDSLERDAVGGEALAQFFFGTLFDPDLKLSTIVQPDIAKAIGWYARGANQGEDSSLRNLALIYYYGNWVRRDYTRGCYYASKLGKGSLQGLGNAWSSREIVTPAASATPRSTWCRLPTPTRALIPTATCAAARHLAISMRTDLAARPKSGETALKYYREAADKGDSLGLHNLGAAYNSGLFGLQRDGGEAARLIVSALETKYEVTVQSLTTHPEIWSADFWQNLQRRLAEKGLYNGPIDGRANAATLDAVKRLGRN